jgi:hypothetical protein
MATSCPPVANTWLPAAAAHAHVSATIVLLFVLNSIALQELLLLEVVELRRELEGLEAELAAAQQDAAHASNRVKHRAGGENDLMHEQQPDGRTDKRAAADASSSSSMSSNSSLAGGGMVTLQHELATSSSSIAG